MNREDIIRMAREAGLWEADISKPLFDFATLVAAAEREKVTFEMVDEAQRAVQESVAAEREACAKVCDGLQDVPATEPRHCAQDIRLRGNV